MGSPKLDNPDAIEDWVNDMGWSYQLAGEAPENYWKIREKVRFLTGQYKRLPSDVAAKLPRNILDAMDDHYVHVSVEDPGMIAYTPDERHGQQDRQIRTRFGRYLHKEMGKDISPELISEVGALLRNVMSPPELHIARTEEEIAMVYDEGPRSCMGGAGREFDHDVAPVRVYASPDCAVAYCYRGERIVARTVLNMLEHTYTTIYGDESALIPILEEAGYYEGCDLNGCRLKQIIHEGEYIMPYLDGATQTVSETHKDGQTWWRVEPNGNYDCTSQYGYLEDTRVFCDWCERSHDEEHVHWTASVQATVCDSCHDHHFVYAYTGRYQEYIPNDHEDIAGTYGYDCYTYEALEHHDLVCLDGGHILPADEVSEDPLTGEWIETSEGTEYLDVYRDLQYTLEAQELVWSTVEEVHIAKDDAVLLSDGVTYVLPDDSRIEADKAQIKIPDYVAVETALIEAEVYAMKQRRIAA